MQEGDSLRRSWLVSSLVALAALALFVGVSAVIPRPTGQAELLTLSLFLAFIPALVWIGFFYFQDRAEPEPKRLLVRVFAFGALAAGAAAVPFAVQVANEAISSIGSLAGRLVLTIMTISLMQEVLKVAMVRYVVLGTSEFDEHPDGIVYGLASGVGFATVLTIAYVLESGGVLPLSGSIRAVDNVLVHGALGAVTGYYIGRVKIDGKQLPWLATGVAMTTLVNGIYQVTLNELSRRFAYNPWLDLAVAAALAAVVGAVLFYFFRLALRRASGDLATVSEQIHARAKSMPWDIALRYDGLLVSGLLVALIVGVGAGVVQRSRAVTYAGDVLPVTFRYPAGWALEAGGSASVAVSDLAAGGVFNPMMVVEARRATEGAALDFVVAQDLIAQEQGRAFYLETQRLDSVTVAGQPAIQVRYQYAAGTPAGPAVITGAATYVLHEGKLYIFRYEAEPADFTAGLGLYERLLASAKFGAGE